MRSSHPCAAQVVVDDGRALTATGHFELAAAPIVIPNATENCTIDDVLSLNRTLSYVRNALSDDDQAALESEMRALVASTFGEDEFPFPWVTKCWLLRARAP